MLLSKKYLSRLTAALVLAGGLSCTALAEEYSNPRDPWEGFNRGVFAFNEAVDGALIKPVAQGYEFIIPEPIRILVTNLFSNLGDVVIGVNDLLQGRGEQAYNSFGRVLINTTLGFGDLLLPQPWRLLAGMEAANGFLTFGLLTALLIEGLRQVRLRQAETRRHDSR